LVVAVAAVGLQHIGLFVADGGWRKFHSVVTGWVIFIVQFIALKLE
jgi:hypothetical protein